MKLSVSYIVFDGVELLEHSIRQIRKHANHISVIYQNFSWFGKKLSAADLIILKSLARSGQIDELILFSSFVPLRNKTQSSILTAKSYERDKRQVGLSAALRNSCTHYLCMDVDEFYTSDQFATAKNLIKTSGFESTAVRLINYVNIPTVHRGYDSIRVPFICKISNASKMSTSFFVKCDPTRGISPVSAKKHEFAPNIITMHHMETVRKDILLKYDSTTRMIFNRERTRELINSIKSVNEKSKSVNFKKIIFPGLNQVTLSTCKNIFGIPYTTWKKK